MYNDCNFKRSINTILLFMLLLFLSGCLDDDKMIQAEESMEMAVSVNAQRMYESLQNSFSGSGEIIFPDYYAGSYVEDDQLVVAVTLENSQTRQDIRKRIGSDEFITRKVKYSLAKLNAIQDKMTELQREGKGSLPDIAVSSILIMQNCISVGFVELSEENITVFLDVLDEDAEIFDFHQSPGIILD